MKSGANKPSILIIAYGNPLRGDDSVGWHAAERLYQKHFEPSVHIITCHQLTPELVEDLFGAELVIFIDASAVDPPGSIVCRTKLYDCNDPRIVTHNLTPDRLICFARKQFGVTPRAMIYTVGGASFGFDERLSAPVERALDDLTDRIVHWIAWWEGRQTPCPDTTLSSPMPM